MIFWLIILGLGAFSALTLARAMRIDRAAGRDDPIALYTAQLAEVDRDAAAGRLAPEEAEATRTEIARRILAADKAGPRTTSRAPASTTVVGSAAVALAVVAISLGGYLWLGAPGYGDLPIEARLQQAEDLRASRPSQDEAEALALQDGRVNETDSRELNGEFLALLGQLRQAMAERPDDLRGLRLLALHEARAGNYAAARAAQARLIDLLGEDATPQDHLGWADRAIAAAGGQVSQELEDRMIALLEEDSSLSGARYYAGLAWAQVDRPDIAFRFWRDLAERGDPDDPYAALARSGVREAAFRAGLDYEPPATGPGPDADALAAAADMTPEARAAMIEGMVAQLSDRLATQGGPAEDWARLIRAYGVLGDTEAASEIWAEARQAFAGSPEAMDQLSTAAQSVGLQ